MIDSFDGKVVAVTGSGSGIGRALARNLARRGAHLALSDVDEAGLAETVAGCEGHGVKVTAARVDVADRDAVFAWADAVVDQHGAVHVVVNNAGVALIADVADMSIGDFEWLMSINFWGVVHGTNAFLPRIEAAGGGHVVNVSSVFGLISVPSQAAYNSAKFAVRGFTDALRIELDIARSPVSATTVHPGGIRTNIVRNARTAGHNEFHDPDEFDKVARTTPDAAAETILEGVLRNRRRVLIGADAKVIDLLSRLPTGVRHRLLVAGGRRAARAR